MVRSLLLSLVVLAVGCGVTTERDASANATGGLQTCAPTETTLFAGQTLDVGTVTVSNTATDLTVAIDTTAPWLLKKVHVYVGTGPVPTNSQGVPAPGQFPHHSSFTTYESNYAVTFSLADLVVACNETLTVAVHTETVRVVNGVVVQEETGWGFGTEFDADRWGWSFTHTVCCQQPPDEEEGCTLTQGYWKTHHAGASVAALDKAWPIDEATELCGRTWLDILRTPPAKGNAWFILAHQYIAAKLNAATGATVPADAVAALAQAESLLAACSIEAADRAAALAAAMTLDEYNNGLIGPGHCE